MSSPIREKELTVPALKLLAAAPNGFLTTTEIISKLEQHFKPTGIDAELLDNRNDTHFSQKVRNVVSHRGSSSSPISKGWITYSKVNSGVTITDKGRQILRELG